MRDRSWVVTALAARAQVDKRLADALQRIEQYKAIATSAEDQLKDLQSNQTELEARVAEQKVAHEAETTALRQRADDADARGTALRADVDRLQAEVADANSRLSATQVDAEKTLASARTIEADAKEALAQAESSNRDMAQKMADSTDSYQREVTMHAADVEALKTVRAQHDAAAKALREAMADLDTARADLASSKASWCVHGGCARCQRVVMAVTAWCLVMVVLFRTLCAAGRELCKHSMGAAETRGRSVWGVPARVVVMVVSRARTGRSNVVCWRSSARRSPKISMNSGSRTPTCTHSSPNCRPCPRCRRRQGGRGLLATPVRVLPMLTARRRRATVPWGARL